MGCPKRIKTQNPYLKSIDSIEYQIWQEGYESKKDNNVNIEDKKLLEVYNAGKQAYLNDIKYIPKGIYCHGDLIPETKEDGSMTGSFQSPQMCPYWYQNEGPPQSNGACAFLNIEDGDESGAFLLWDQCKECGINSDE